MHPAAKGVIDSLIPRGWRVAELPDDGLQKPKAGKTLSDPGTIK
jgi:hypothetical protein